MKYPALRMSLLMCLFLASCASQNASAQDSKPEFRVRLKNSGDQVTILREDSQTIIDIRSDFGIGSASFELVSGTMPNSALLRLHVNGLEELQVSSANVTIGASASTGETGFPVRERIVSPGVEVPIGSIHPLWLDIQFVPDKGDTPDEEGYFEIALPSEFMRNAGASFEVRWVDFYR